jgi:Zn finger protein HypA/HybF involved in hydrogenase expression
MPSLSEDDLLPFCPQCGAWPMAAKATEPDRITFRCPRCHSDQVKSTRPTGGGGQWGVRAAADRA